MLIYDIEKRGQRPIYEYLYECIRNDIVSGVLKSGEKLPSRRQMSMDNGIAEITVSNAYAQLQTEGYLESREKKGYFVASDICGLIIPAGGTVSLDGIVSSGGIITEDEDGSPSKTCGKECPEDEESGACIVTDLANGSLPEETFPFDTWSKLCRRILSEKRSECIKAPGVKGLEVLRKAIAEYLGRARGFSPDPERIIVGPGTEYLNNVLLNLIGGSACIAVEDPGYRNIGRLYENSGRKCLHVPVDENGLVTDGLSGSNVRLIHVSPSHHFPLGVVMTASRRASLMAWAERENAWIVEDDYDSEFRFEGRPVPPISAAGSGRVVYMNTFSRTLSPSVRIAYMILPEDLYRIFERKFSFHSGSVPTLEQLTLASFISGGYYERHLSRMRNFYRKRKRKIFEIVTTGELSGFFDIEGDGSGMTFILRAKTGFNGKKFINTLKNEGVLLNSLEEYCYNTSDFFQNRYIVNFGSVDEEQFEKAADKMCSALKG